MLLSNAESTLCHRRYDLTHPALIFGGLLLTATAICGTLQVPATPVVPVEEVLVLNDEGVVIPDGVDPFVMSCDVKKRTLGSGTYQPVAAGTDQADCPTTQQAESTQTGETGSTESGSTSSASSSLH